MKFLVDMALSPDLAAWLCANAHDALHASAMGLSEAADDVILARAAQEQRILVTADLDFPRLMALFAVRSPGLILFRGGEFSARETEALLSRVLGQMSEQELDRSIVIVERSRIRKRPLPIRPVSI